MSQPYEGRHRHAAAPRRSRARSSGVHRALRRPVVTSSLLLAVVATSAAGYQAGDGHQAGAGFTVSAAAIEQANELSDARIEDEARLASARNEANTSRAAVQERDRQVAAAAAAAAAQARKEAAERAAREKARQALEAKKAAILARAKEDPRAAARVLLPDYGWGDSQFSCLDQLWHGESGWRWNAENPTSGAYGIPQSLPASKMATVGADYRTNPVTQIIWGLKYIKSSYGSPCNAWDFWQSKSPHWY